MVSEDDCVLSDNSAKASRVEEERGGGQGRRRRVERHLSGSRSPRSPDKLATWVVTLCNVLQRYGQLTSLNGGSNRFASRYACLVVLPCMFSTARNGYFRSSRHARRPVGGSNASVNATTRRRARRNVVRSVAR